MKKLVSVGNLFRRAIHKFAVEPFCKGALAECGEDVRIGRHYVLSYKNVHVGDCVSINYGAHFLSSRAKKFIGDHVMFGPNVTIVIGNHRTDIPGRFKDTVRDGEILPENDQDVVFEGDNWIGTGTIIHRVSQLGMGAS